MFTRLRKNKVPKRKPRWNVENSYAVRQKAENFVEKLFLQILIDTHKPVPVLFAFRPVDDAMADISPPVRLYRKMCVVTVKR